MKNIAFAVLILVIGCVTSSHRLTGTARSPISADQVKVYDRTPENSKLIGTVSATSFRGLTLHDAQDDAVQELKIEAGNMGANGVVLTSPDGSDDNECAGAKMEGSAIYVSP